MPDIQLPYPQSLTTRASFPVFWQSNFKANDFGLVRPNEDPGLTLDEIKKFRPTFTEEQVQKLNADSKDQGSFVEGYYLPKGVFDPTKRDFDPTKKTLVISYTEDDSPHNFLAALDRYFKLEVPEIESIKDQFNILIAWSTSTEDMVKSLKLVQQKIGDWSKAAVLFLNDFNINEGSGPNYRELGYDMNWLGNKLTGLAQDIFGLSKEQTSSVIQTGDRVSWNLNGMESNTSSWKSLNTDDTNQVIDQIANAMASGKQICINKVHRATGRDNEPQELTKAEDIKGVHIPIQSFLKSLAS